MQEPNLPFNSLEVCSTPTTSTIYTGLYDSKGADNHCDISTFFVVSIDCLVYGLVVLLL